MKSLNLELGVFLLEFSLGPISLLVSAVIDQAMVRKSILISSLVMYGGTTKNSFSWLPWGACPSWVPNVDLFSRNILFHFSM